MSHFSYKDSVSENAAQHSTPQLIVTAVLAGTFFISSVNSCFSFYVFAVFLCKFVALESQDCVNFPSLF